VASRTVGDIMSSPALTATSSETVAEVAGRMDDHKVGSVVVVDGNRPIGILTERDLIRFAAAGADPSATKVSEWMTDTPHTVTPDTEIIEAWNTLHEKGYRHIPVVEDDGTPIGVVAAADVFRHIAAALG
jgi:CBS domain-containing protein